MGILLVFVSSTQPWYEFVQKDIEEEFMDLPKLWFRKIIPSLGEDKKLSKYGIIGKICLTGLRKIPTTSHRMMIKYYESVDL